MVDTVEIKRRFRSVVGFRFNALAGYLLCQHWGVDLNSMDKIPADEYLSSYLWCAHRSFSMMRYRKPVIRTPERMKCWIENLRKNKWDVIVKAMTEAKGEAGDDKKKVPVGQNSSPQDGGQG
jgi:hypothetical protein